MDTKHEIVQKNNYYSVVIGAGPIGLLSTLCLLKHCSQGEKKALIADRLEELGLRQQILWIEMMYLILLNKQLVKSW